MSQVLPPEDAIEAVFKPPEPLPHSYLPTPPRSQGATLAAPVSLRLPKGMRTGRNPAGTLGSLSTEELASGREDTGPPSLSYQKVRRWEMLPKHAWLQAAESGQAPGPGFRNVSSTQTMRSYGPKGSAFASLAAPQAPDQVADAAGRAPKASLSSVIAAHYSPSAAGLMPSLLYMGVPDSALELEVCLYYITMRTCVTRLCSVSCHHCLPDAAHRRARSGQMRCLLSSVHMPCVSQRANSLSL